MNVIFLDFDGVLNSRKYCLSQVKGGVAIDPAKMVLLKQLVDATGAQIVLSTSWREHWQKDDSTGREIDRIFRTYGLRILDKTPMLGAGREQEIKTWLDDHPEVMNFVVLDDAFLGAEYLKGHFVKTSYYVSGLNEADVQKAIGILIGKEVCR